MKEETGKTFVSGTIKPLVWEGSESDCFMHVETLFGEYQVWVEYGDEWGASFEPHKGRNVRLHAYGYAHSAKAAAQADYEARIAAQIQTVAEAKPVASGEAGELLPCPFCSSSQIEDVMRTGAVVCQDCRASATNNRQWNRRALPAARAEVSAAEAARRLAYDCDYSAEVLRDAGTFPTAEGILRQAADTLRALTEAGE